MTYEIRGDRLHIGGRAVRFVPARDVGGRITPTLIVLHDTAGGLAAGGSISWLAGNPKKTSAHVVVARDGAITQLADFDRKTNHAGASQWRGRAMCNGFAIGIEIVNPGRLLERGDGAVSSAGHVYDRAQYGIGCCTSEPHGGKGWWMPYTPEQLAAVEALVAALARAYPSIKEVVGHHDISPGRKVDPTPLMPWSSMRQALAGARNAVTAPVVADRERQETAYDVAGVQARLAELGYYTGLHDGALGARTEAAVFAFQRENRIAANGQIDRATVTLLQSPDAKALPTGHREEATPQTLAADGSQTMGSALSDVRDGKVQTALAGVTGLLVAAKTLLQEAGLEIVIVLCLGTAAYFGWRQMRRGGHLAGHRLAEHKKGVK